MKHKNTKEAIFTKTKVAAPTMRSVLLFSLTIIVSSMLAGIFSSGIIIALKPKGLVLPGQAIKTPINNLQLITAIYRDQEIDFFNQNLKPDDVVFTWGAKPRLLSQVSTPQTSISANWLEDLKQDLELLDQYRPKVDFVTYNPEQWGYAKMPEAKKAELDQLVDSVKEARELASAYGAKLAFVTDEVLLAKFGSEIAPLADTFTVQLQRYQRGALEDLRRVAVEQLRAIKRANPKILVYGQLLLNPPAWQTVTKPNGQTEEVKVAGDPLPVKTILAQIRTMHDLVAGIVLLYDEQSVEQLKEVISALR